MCTYTHMYVGTCMLSRKIQVGTRIAICRGSRLFRTHRYDGKQVAALVEASFLLGRLGSLRGPCAQHGLVRSKY